MFKALRDWWSGKDAVPIEARPTLTDDEMMKIHGDAVREIERVLMSDTPHEVVRLSREAIEKLRANGLATVMSDGEYRAYLIGKAHGYKEGEWQGLRMPRTAETVPAGGYPFVPEPPLSAKQLEELSRPDGIVPYHTDRERNAITSVSSGYPKSATAGMSDDYQTVAQACEDQIRKNREKSGDQVVTMPIIGPLGQTVDVPMTPGIYRRELAKERRRDSDSVIIPAAIVTSVSDSGCSDSGGVCSGGD